MRFSSLGSGSQGNALIVQAGTTHLMLDCGFSTKTTVERLANRGLEPQELTALLVTHEHGDHIAGVFKFARRFQLPVYLTHGTFLAAQRSGMQLPECRLIDSHAAFAINDVEVQPFPVPHDAREPVQFTFSNGVFCLGVLTDTGSITAHILERLKHCHALVLECNHDLEMLAQSAYPASVKRRISGKFGHLDNTQAAGLLQKIETKQLQHIIAAHLSEQNNSPAHAVAALVPVLNCSADWIGIASQESGFAWRELL